MRPLLILALAPLLSHCTSISKQHATAVPAGLQERSAPSKNSHAPASAEAKAQASSDEFDEYAVAEIADPFEKINRGTFWLNDKLYLVLLRPISKGYQKLLPKPVRKGIDNAFDNIKFPVRFVNHTLQGKLGRSAKETEKFLLNTVVGLGGIIRVSDKVPTLAELPDQDTGMTFAKWGMGHGAYLVLPVLGPSSVRDGIGLIGDHAMNPVNWGVFWGGNHDWTMIPPYVNTVRALPVSLDLYDSANRDAIDPYISIRSAYGQFREQAVQK